jgi:predicted chitinase/uncharacterized Zn-binding protein involved in type VI secretion
MAKSFAINNSMTNHGGIIQATQQRTSQMGNLFLCAGDGHFCPKCKCWSTIQASHNHIIMDGKPVAYADDLLSCGAKILPKQDHVVGTSQGENYRSLTIANVQPVLQQNLTNNLLVADKEENKDKICFCTKDITEEFLKQVLPKDVLTKGLFYRSAYPKVKGMNIQKFLVFLNTAMKTFEINTCLRKAHFLAQISCEGDHFKTTEEYKNRDGSIPDNWKNYKGGAAYHGRGLIQLTHNTNYEKYGSAIGQKFVPDKIDFIASEPEHVVNSAAWYWKNGSPWGDANTYADKDDVHYITMLVNGGFNDYCGRKNNLLKLIQAMEIKEHCIKIKASKQTIGVYDFKNSKLNTSKVGKNIWIGYHTNKKKLPNVSCESL